jgi:hypothetical protein
MVPMLFLPSQMKRIEDGDRDSSRNVEEPSRLGAAVCPRNFIEFCRRQNLKTCLFRLVAYAYVSHET